MSCCPAGDERGQVAVELALALPLLAVLLLGAIQVALVMRDQVLVTHAAREAAREAAVSPEAAAVRDAATAAGPLDRERLRVQLLQREDPGGRARVRVTYRSVTDLPLVGALVSDVTLTAEASMRVE